MENDDALSRRSFLRVGTASAAAAAGTGAAGTAAAQEGTETGTGTETGDGTTGTGTDTGGGGGGGATSERVLVGPGGALEFDPEELTIATGTTVNFVWDSDNHNVVPQSQPEDASWPGKGEQGVTFDSGTEYSYTFEVTGTYDYVCTPHESAGMIGSIEVVEELETAAPVGPAVPDSAKTLGVGAAFAMVATLLIAFFFLQFGGDSPGHDVEE